MQKFWYGMLAALLMAFMGCNEDNENTGPGPDDTPTPAVFVMTNATNNAVVRFARDEVGLLGGAHSFPTYGNGLATSLGSQGALAITDDDRYVLAVNAGSNDVTVFSAHGDSLRFVGRTGSGGTKPISVAVFEGLVYVLNAEGSANLAGFRLTSAGDLLPLANSARALPGGSSSAPAQVGFSNGGNLLVVTEKATSQIDVFPVASDGTLDSPRAQPSSGTTPFGFAFSPANLLVVSNANVSGGSPVLDGSSLSTYMIDTQMALQVKSNQVPTTETAACWVVVSSDGGFVYTSNAGSSSITGFRLVSDQLTAIHPDGRTAVTGPANARPAELALTQDGKLLYVLNSGTGNVVGYAVSANGTLLQITDVGGLPAESYGMVAN